MVFESEVGVLWRFHLRLFGCCGVCASAMVRNYSVMTSVARRNAVAGIHKVESGVNTSADRSIEQEEGTERVRQGQWERERTQGWSSGDWEGEYGRQAEGTK